MSTKQQREKWKKQFRKYVGIDYDTKDKMILERAERRIREYPNLFMLNKIESKNGWHYDVILKKQVTVWQSFYLRYWFGDDHLRLLLDILRWHKMHNAKVLDILFDKKTYIEEMIKLK